MLYRRDKSNQLVCMLPISVSYYNWLSLLVTTNYMKNENTVGWKCLKWSHFGQMWYIWACTVDLLFPLLLMFCACIDIIRKTSFAICTFEYFTSSAFNWATFSCSCSNIWAGLYIGWAWLLCAPLLTTDTFHKGHPSAPNYPWPLRIQALVSCLVTWPGLSPSSEFDLHRWWAL